MVWECLWRGVQVVPTISTASTRRLRQIPEPLVSVTGMTGRPHRKHGALHVCARARRRILSAPNADDAIGAPARGVHRLQAAALGIPRLKQHLEPRPNALPHCIRGRLGGGWQITQKYPSPGRCAGCAGWP